jgi:alpha-mannosidase
LDRRYGEISECDLLENKSAVIAENASEFVCTINPYEIKTFRLEPVSGLQH